MVVDNTTGADKAGTADKAGADDGKKTETKTYTQDEVDRITNSVRSTVQNEFGQKVTELTTQVQTLTTEKEKVQTDSMTEMQQLQKSVETLTNTVSEERSARQDIEKKRVDEKINSHLMDIAVKSNVRRPQDAVTLFRQYHNVGISDSGVSGKGSDGMVAPASDLFANFLKERTEMVKPENTGGAGSNAGTSTPGSGVPYTPTQGGSIFTDMITGAHKG